MCNTCTVFPRVVLNEMWFDMSVSLSIKRLNNNGVGGRGGRGYHSLETVIYMHIKTVRTYNATQWLKILTLLPEKEREGRWRYDMGKEMG
jgi:hypothetical protein